MYKIYIGETPVFLLKRKDLATYQKDMLRDLVVYHQPKQRNNLYQVVDNLEKWSGKYDSVLIVSNKLEQLREDFFSIYKVVPAAGGVVQNKAGAVLSIFRLGCWDLPKGKLEKGESLKQSALREVQEETGVQHLKLGDFLGHTYHTYNNKKGKPCLKDTAWYKMKSEDQTLVPQTEEGIEKVVWMPLEELLAQELIYKNIVEILNRL
jgi:8-oxo-dGTP pyrophosphatase MutT (NUDIX family)